MNARVGGADLFYETLGDGPPLLLLHGAGLDHTYLRPWHDGLARRHRVIYVDQRLHGQSSRDGTADLEVWADDAVGLLDVLRERRALVLGHSSSAWLAMALALRHPDRVRGLVLTGASPGLDHAAEIAANARARDPALAELLLAGLSVPPATDDALAAVWRAILPLYFHGPPRPEILAQTRYSAAGFAAAMACVPTQPTPAHLPDIATPVLVVAGADDFITSPVQGRRIAGGVQRGELALLDEAGHFAFVEQTAPYVEAILGWTGALAH